MALSDSVDFPWQIEETQSILVRYLLTEVLSLSPWWLNNRPILILMPLKNGQETDHTETWDKNIWKPQLSQGLTMCLCSGIAGWKEA